MLRLTYANVMSTIAVFVAIGGTSYAAITLPRNSVGGKQIRAGAVGPQELRRGAVTSSDIRDRSVTLRDLSAASLAAVNQPGPAGPAGPVGPAGVEFRATVAAGGVVLSGNGSPAGSEGFTRLIRFPRDLSSCTPVATLARNAGGLPEDPGPGRIVVSTRGDIVAVETFTAGGDVAALPFNLLVAC